MVALVASMKSASILLSSWSVKSARLLDEPVLLCVSPSSPSEMSCARTA